MSLINKIFGRPLSIKAQKQQELTVLTGVPALGLDALASTAYGPEAALMILAPLGILGLHYFPYIILGIVGVLITLYLSYQQTAAAYPAGGGAYIVASDNLGKRVGVWAAIALLLDYLLNVAVGISAGVGAVVSAIPILQPHILVICLLVLLMLTFLNLRGIKETGTTFILPTIVFVVCITGAIVLGIINTWISGGHPHPIKAPPPLSAATETVTLWLLLGAFANGLTAMTGVEAVSNAVPLFRKPTVRNAQLTLTVIVAILGLFLLALGYLCPAYHIIAMDETKPGYQTILSQLVVAVAGNGVFYYFSIAFIFIVLTYSAQTSFADFPRVCRLLAEDDFLPHFFADRGRRLVYSYGIVGLAILSAILLIVFKGITLALIPLFAVGAFSAFLFSQLGMVVHWLRRKDQQGSYLKLFFNALGAVITAIALVIIIAAKFLEGAWVVVVSAPILALLFYQIKRHYTKTRCEIEKPLELQVGKLQPPIVIIPIRGWDCIAEKALRFGLLLSDDVTAIHISIECDEVYEKRFGELWNEKVKNPAKEAQYSVPKLKIINSPSRQIYKRIIAFVNKVRKKNPDRLIAVIIPELVEPHWYENLLHNIHAAGLRALLFLQRDPKTIVITTPWYLR